MPPQSRNPPVLSGQSSTRAEEKHLHFEEEHRVPRPKSDLGTHRTFVSQMLQVQGEDEKQRQQHDTQGAGFSFS